MGAIGRKTHNETFQTPLQKLEKSKTRGSAFKTRVKRPTSRSRLDGRARIRFIFRHKCEKMMEEARTLHALPLMTM